jgi:hypothetical protein
LTERAHHTAPWELVAGRSLSELLEVTNHATSGGCRWRRGTCPSSDHDRIDAAAWLVAKEIMGLRCGRARGIYRAWHAAATGTPGPLPTDLEHIAPFVEPTFGLPPNGGSVDHAQGYVAEVTWRMLAKEESSDERSVVHLERPDSDVTAPGADGFVIYRMTPEQRLAFRLWEIKKRDGSGSISTSIRNAYRQLDENAERYLAKLTGQSEVPDTDAELVALLADLVPAWKRADPTAGAGVSVAADAAGLPARAFSTMHKHFPAFVAAGGIEGCLVGLGSLRQFTLFVRTLLWTGLSTATT